MATSLFEEKKTVSKQYLLQVHRIKLQDYIKCGLIAPDIYLSDEIESDIQSKNKNFLVVSDGYIAKLDEYQILIELILTDEEIHRLHRSESVCYFDFPIPITRIKKVYTQDENIVKNIVKNIETSEKGFLPKELFDVYEENKKCIFDKQEYSNLAYDIHSDDYSKKVIKFDKRMGMFSFMKNTNIYYSDEKEYISNYSDNYEKTLLNYLESKPSFSDLRILKENESFKELLYSDKQIDKEFIEDVCNSIENKELKNIFSKLLEPNSTKKTLPLLLEKEPFIYYFIALIYYFKQKNSNKSDNFKINIKDFIPQKVAEIALAIMGIYLGYTNLRASEKYEIKDKVFKNIYGDEFNMKFRLDTKLDYFTIESIYRYSFYDGKKSESFEYLNYPKKQKPIKLPTDEEFKTWHEVEEKNLFDAQYLKVTKKSFIDVVKEKLGKYDEEISLDNYLLCFVARHYKYLLFYSKDGRPVEPYFEKSNFLKIIEEETNTIREEELLKVFEMGYR